VQVKILKGVRVVELATVVAAPSAAALLSDYGADVIKVFLPPAFILHWE
jgi:crotonobetainyl-CoA:carnitine CoA-transferase CaiB-like acyl-CoA transferase